MEKLFLSVLNMSLTGTIVILAVCIARLPLRKAPKIISYCLWCVAGFRLLVPVSIESAFSLMPINPQPIPIDIAMLTSPYLDSDISFIDNIVTGMLPAAMPDTSINALQMSAVAGAYIWITGFAVFLLYGLISYFALKRKMQCAVYKEANIYEAAVIKSPFVLGVLAPKIYLPADLSEHERGYILLHEQTHIRRHDHIVKIAAYFIMSLHWFNPLAWLAFLLMSADMEMSCDEYVLKELGSDIRVDYSSSLIRIATNRRVLSGSPLAFGEGGMKDRVKRVLNFRKPSRIILITAIVSAALFSMGFAVNRSDAVSSQGTLPESTMLISIGNTVYDTSLTEIEIIDLNLSSEDIAPLEYMTSLQRLNLNGNQIDDISVLGNLTGLTQLSLAGNSISDISVLSELQELSELYLGSNNIVDISPLRSLTRLAALDLGFNQISDIEPLSGLINITRMSLRNNQITDITALEKLTSIDTLDLSSNSISDISILEKHTNLWNLYLFDMLIITDIPEDARGFEMPVQTENPIPDEQVEQIKALLPNVVIG